MLKLSRWFRFYLKPQVLKRSNSAGAAMLESALTILIFLLLTVGTLELITIARTLTTAKAVAAITARAAAAPLPGLKPWYNLASSNQIPNVEFLYVVNGSPPTFTPPVAPLCPPPPAPCLQPAPPVEAYLIDWARRVTNNAMRPFTINDRLALNLGLGELRKRLPQKSTVVTGQPSAWNVNTHLPVGPNRDGYFILPLHYNDATDGVDRIVNLPTTGTLRINDIDEPAVYKVCIRHRAVTIPVGIGWVCATATFAR